MTKRTATQLLKEEKEKSKELQKHLEDVLLAFTTGRTVDEGNGHGTPAQVAEIVAAPLIPSQPMPKKRGWFQKKQPVTYVTSIIVKSSGLYLEKINEANLPPDARLWRYAGNYIYSLWESTVGKYEVWEPTGGATQLPEKLWRAVKAAPIRKVFTYKNTGLEKLNLGLGIAFVITCMVVLFIIAQSFTK